MNKKLHSELLRELIVKNQERSAIEELRKLNISANHKNALTIIEANLNNIEGKNIKGTIQVEKFDLVRSKNLSSILQIIDEIKETESRNTDTFSIINLAKDEDSIKENLKERLDNKYEIREPFHSNDRSIIFKALYKSSDNNKEVFRAIKVIKPYSILEIENFNELHTDIREIKDFETFNNGNYILDHDVDNYPWYFVMNYIQGKSISDYIKEGHCWRIDEVLDILLKIINTVTSCHNSGKIHGNLKPSKIRLNHENEDNPVISPFKIIANSFYSKRTTDRILHNCRYMSPEELVNGTATSKSDQFSIGLIAFEMIKNRPLYSGENALSVIKERIKHEENEDFLSEYITNKDCPESFIEILKKMLHTSPDNRFNNLKDLKIEISSIYNNEYSKLKKEAEAVRESYARCNSEEFITYFYKNFFAKNPGAESKFPNIGGQYQKLNDSINQLVKISTLDKGRIRREMTDSAKFHSDRGIKNEEYDIFKNELILAIEKFDKENWTPQLKKAWEKILEEGTRLMKYYTNSYK